MAFSALKITQVLRVILHTLYFCCQYLAGTFACRSGPSRLNSFFMTQDLDVAPNADVEPSEKAWENEYQPLPSNDQGNGYEYQQLQEEEEDDNNDKNEAEIDVKLRQEQDRFDKNHISPVKVEWTSEIGIPQGKQIQSVNVPCNLVHIYVLDDLDKIKHIMNSITLPASSIPGLFYVS